VSAGGKQNATDSAKKRSATFGKAAYQVHCFQCHGPGMMGAPKIGDRQEWQKRLVQGSPAVVENAIKGIGNHPPKGGSYSLTNDELREMILYMITPSK
jgi:cytochrome c5